MPASRSSTEILESADACFLGVAFPGPFRQLFDYKTENGKQAGDYPIGCRVEAPFGSGRKVGFVIAHQRGSSICESKVKPVLKQLDENSPGSSDGVMRLAHWLADYYHHPVGDCLATMLPNLLSRAGKDAGGYHRRVWEISTHGLGLGESALPRAPKQQALLAELRHRRKNSDPAQGLDDTELQSLGHKISTARELARKGLIVAGQQSYIPADCKALIHGSGNDMPLQLNPEQQAALDGISSMPGQFAACLLEGITGSGKTEVYLQAISRVLGNNQQVLVLIPEIGLTPQTLARFASRFDCQIAILHSGLNDRERLAAWQAARNGQARIVIGTRSAVFTPLPEPGLIIVDEEHDSSYKQQEGLRYHARDVAVVRGKFESIPVILGSATPSLESLQNASRGNYQHLELTRRAANSRPADVEFIDIRHQALHEGLSDASIQAIADTLSAGGQALVFINRRGFAPLLMCTDCGWSAECQSCDARLTLHLKAGQLRCHHCDRIEMIPGHCPRCASSRIQYLGQGTERTAETLGNLFPSVDVIRIDRDTSGQKFALANYIETINRNKPLIIVGTQMLAKGHDFRKLDTVVVLNIDDTLYQTDFRAAESTLQLLTQVSGRAGRSSHCGRVLIQTHLPDHPLLCDWAAHGYQGISQQLLEERQQRQLPPYGYMAVLRADSTKAQQAMQYLQRIAELLKNRNSLHSQLVGPLPALMEKRAGRHRAHLLFKAAARKPLHRDISLLMELLAAERQPGSLRWSIDIDPQETV